MPPGTALTASVDLPKPSASYPTCASTPAILVARSTSSGFTSIVCGDRCDRVRGACGQCRFGRARGAHLILDRLRPHTRARIEAELALAAVACGPTRRARFAKLRCIRLRELRRRCVERQTRRRD